MARYFCKHCGRDDIERDSDKAWIKSYCAITGKNARITRVKEIKGEATRPPENHL